MALDWTKLYKQYNGLWVALASDEKTVLGTGKTVKEALAQAAKAKYNYIPILTKVPLKLVPYVGAI